MAGQISLTVYNPNNGEPIKQLECDTQKSVSAKLAAAENLFFDRSQYLHAGKRIAILQQTAERLISRHKEIAKLIATEAGKPLKDAIVEVERAAFSLEQAAACLLTSNDTAQQINNVPDETHYHMTTAKFPIGPVVAISAFNHPLNLVTHQLASAFAAGCPCVIKPASETPLSCLMLIELFNECGMPSHWMSSVITDDLNLAENLVTDNRVAFFSFIGSAKVGWYLRSQLSPGTRCALEHGGIAPAFVDASADIDNAVSSLIRGAFYHAGQVCVSTQRIYIHESIFDEFKQRFVARAYALKVGDATQDDTDVGPIIRASDAQRIARWVDEAIGLGAELALGGNRFGNQFMEVTVLANVPDDAAIMRSEVFGPVCCLQKISNLHSVIEGINREPYAFHSAVFSNDHSTIQKIYEQLHTGCLMINEHTAFRHDGMPFQGLKQSGLGVGGIPHSIEHLQVEKLLITKRLNLAE